MVREFMHDDMVHQLGQGDIVADRQLVQNRAAKQPDRVHRKRLIADGFFGHGDADIQPGQRIGIAYIVVGQYAGIRHLGHLDTNIQGGLGKGVGQMGTRF